MKILIIHTKYKYSGGEDTVVAEEIKLLQSKGTVKLLEFNNYENPFLKLLLIPFNFKSYLITTKTLTEFKPDVVHIHNLHFGASASVITAIKRSKIPFVTTLHNYRLLCPSGILFFKGKPFLDSINKKFAWKAVKLGVYKNSRIITFWVSLSNYIHNQLNTFKISNRYIVLSEHAKQLFLQSTLGLKNEQIVIKPNFCFNSKFENMQTTDDFLFVGRLSEEKGIKFLLEVFSTCPYKINIAGDGPLKDEVIEFSSRFSNINFLGTLNKQEVFNLLKSCTALIFPSIWFEGMPLTIIEAFSCSTPVISSKLGAMESMIIPNYNGLHFESQNKAALRKCLDEWTILSKEQKETYRVNARKTYEKLYTPEENLKQLLNIYGQVINESIPNA